MGYRQALISSGAFLACALASAAAAQGPAPAGAATADETTAVEQVVVTGSRIRTPNLQSNVPVTSVTAAQVQNTGVVSVGDVLNELPSIRSTFSSSNSTRFIGTAGLNFLDLRGLGTTRTLVLVNGRRHVSSSEGSNEVDVNTIPTDLIDRIDVVTGGNSAIYGSDAIGGVVNFVLRRNFDGLQFRAQDGISSRGDGNAWFVSGTGGRNFADNRGNVAVSVEYAKQEDIYFSDRRQYRERGGFVVVDSDPAGATNGSDGIPDRIFVSDTRSLLISEGGTFQTSCIAGNALTCLPNGQARIFQFQPNGTLAEANYGIDFRPLANSSAGGSGATLRRYGQLQPQTQRLAVNLLGHFDVNRAFRPYFEAKFVRNKVFQQSSPSFDQPALLNSGDLISLDNPFLTPETRAFIAARLPAGATSFRLNRNNLDLGVREESIRRDTYRAVLGVEGDLGDAWRYDISATYGEFKKRALSRNNRVEQRYAYALDAVRSPTGQIACRVTVDPTARVPYSPTLASYVASDVAGCVPLNPFGEGAPSEAARAYVNTTSRADGRQTQAVLSGSISGDTSPWFSLPAGPIGLAAGAEYRRETAREAYDELVRAGGTFLNAIPVFDPPAFSVKEAFAEIRVPVLANMRWAQELSLNGAVRGADYRGATGKVLAYNAGLIYAPISDLRFRINYSKSVRAPLLAELYSSPSQNFASVSDPCDVANIGAGTATRAANCAAAGVPNGFINEEARAATLEITSAGNPNLREETAKSWTIGAVLQPRFIPGLTASVDYYDIELGDVISSVAPQQVLNNCYDAADLNNAFCGLFERDPTTRFFVPGSLQDTSLNFAKRRARGIDSDINYRRDLGGAGTLNLRGTVTYVVQRDNYPFIDDPDRPDQILYELGDPRWAFNISAQWKKDKLTLGYQGRYIGKMSVDVIENIRSVGGRPPQNSDFATIAYYPDVMYHDLTAEYAFTSHYSLYGGVENAFDRQPPYRLTGAGEGSGIYDNRGRYFYLGVRANF
jgi:outer membrane receptor protein involved in Fe transport